MILITAASVPKKSRFHFVSTHLCKTELFKRKGEQLFDAVHCGGLSLSGCLSEADHPH